MAYKTFANGFPLPASDLNNYLMNQSVIVFADSSARSAALPTPTEGMITYLEDANNYQYWDGAAWTDLVEAPDLSTLIPKSTVTTAGDLIIADGASSVTRLGIGAADTVLTSNGSTATWAAAGGGGGFNTITEVTASNASYDVSGITGFARITIVAGGGGGSDSNSGSGGNGGSSSVNDGTTTTTASGGAGGGESIVPEIARDNILENANQGEPIKRSFNNQPGRGGEIKIAYYDLTSVSSLNIVVGAGGSGFFDSPGGDGLVILEYAS